LNRGACAFSVLVALAAGAGEARAQAPASASSDRQTWCYIEDTRFLARRSRTDCAGRIVSDDEAREIQAERAARVKAAITPKEPLHPGKRRIGTGSGMVVGADGHVLTNNHVIDHCDAFSVIPADGHEIQATLITADRSHDLALLKAELKGHAAAAFREHEPLPATEIAVVGYPLLGRVAIKPILVEGTVYVGKDQRFADRFAINMDVRRGNSGGPTVDRFGSVVGVVTAKVDTPAVYASTGKAVFEMGIAIRPEVALAFLYRAGVSPKIGGGTHELGNDELLDFVSRYVAQIGCWK
jgi:S1-C subfamily serine protease